MKEKKHELRWKKGNTNTKKERQKDKKQRKKEWMNEWMRIIRKWKKERKKERNCGGKKKSIKIELINE